MTGILSAIGLLFGKLMYFLYNTIGFHNYALSIVLFTIAYKLILLPLSMKQIKSNQKMQEIQPELARIQERYKNDKEKLNEATMKLYQDKGYNPASGCLPLFIQLPILIALFYVIRMPMSYMLDIPAKAVGEATIVAIQKGELSYGNVGEEAYNQIKDDPLAVYQAFIKKDAYYEVKLMSVMDKDPELITNNSYLNDQRKEVLSNFNLKMFNIVNFGLQPKFDFNAIKEDPATYIPPLILLLLAVLTTYFTAALSMPAPPKDSKDKNAASAGCATKGMLWFSPFMTLWIGMTTPCGLSFYWIINNILSFIQQKTLNKIYKKDVKDQKEESNVAKVDSKRGKK